MSPLTAISTEAPSPTAGVMRDRVIAIKNGAIVIAVMRRTKTMGAGSTDGPSHHGGLPTVRPVMPVAAMPKITPPQEISPITRQPRVSKAGVFTMYTVVGEAPIPLAGSQH